MDGRARASGCRRAVAKLSMESDFHVELVFATPVIVRQRADFAAANAELEKSILARRAHDPGIRRSNLGGWHSDTKLFEWAGEASHALAREVILLADANTRDLRGPSEGRRGWILDAWANVSDPGSSNLPHNHGGCYWSAVYYVRVDEGEGGELLLHDPRLPALDMHAPHLRFAHAGAEQSMKIKAQAGTLVMFPSWLMHSVAPWTGPGLRISIAINLSEKPRG
jgi:uncharacterized protein (TIGR02466 family)